MSSTTDEKWEWLKVLGVTGVSLEGKPDSGGPDLAGFNERVVAGPKTDIGQADTDPALKPAKDFGTADTDPNLPPKRIKTPTINDSVPPPPPPPPPSDPPQPPSDSLSPPDYEKVLEKARNDSIKEWKAAYEPVKGDGEVVPLKKAMAELERKPELVQHNWGASSHRDKWNNWLGKKGEPPVAFRANGKIQLNVEALPPDELGAWFVLEAEKLDKHAKGLRRVAANLQKQLEGDLPDQRRREIGPRWRELDLQVEGIEAQLKGMAKRVEAMPEMEGFRGKDPGETFKAAREKFLKRTGALKKIGSALGLLFGAFTIFMEVKGILEAETSQEAIDRVAAVAGGIRDQAVTSAVITKFFPKGPPGVSLVAGLCGDSPSRDSNCQPDAEKVLQERKLAKTDMLNEAVASYMKEMHPELFVKGPNGTVPSDPKLWDETRKQFEEAYVRHQKEQVTKRAEELAGRMRTFQVENGFYEYPVNSYAPEDEDPDPYDPERTTVISNAIEKARQEGYAEGKARREVFWKRANDLGLKDGKKGTPTGMEEIAKWPEVQPSSEMTEKQVLARTKFLNSLLGVYKSAFEAVGGSNNKPGGAAGNMTAGEMAMRDQKAAALKRAKEYGLQDGKKGKPLRGGEIQNWKEVLYLEGSDRSALLHELLETYNKAFASIAPAKAGAAGDGKTTAREMVARDRKAAALKRATELGTADGKLGQKLDFKKIQAWPEVTELEGPDRSDFLQKLLTAYNKAFDAVPKKSGPTAAKMLSNDKKDAALKRARDVGTRDGKAGKRVNFEDIQEWEVVTELEGAERGAFLHELLNAYNTAFDAVPVRLTASEMIERDKKDAALKRAREQGLNDGKAGKISDMKMLQDWSEVPALEPLARGAFIAELIGVYNKARANAVAEKKK